MNKSYCTLSIVDNDVNLKTYISSMDMCKQLKKVSSHLMCLWENIKEHDLILDGVVRLRTCVKKISVLIGNFIHKYNFDIKKTKSN